MNKPQPAQDPSLARNIASVREEIDAIDGAIADLVVRRSALSASVAAAKQAADDLSFGWRPAREIHILRQLLATRDAFQPKLANAIWRALISANLAAQGDLRIFCVNQTYGAACAAFSAGNTPMIMGDSTQILTHLVGDDFGIGILPWPDQDEWWLKLMQPEFAGLHVCAVSPVAGSEPEVMLVSARLPDMAGEDISLVAGPAGRVEGGVIAQSGDMALTAVGDFVGPTDILPAGCRLIGSFALV
jgi:chorismate mutase